MFSTANLYYFTGTGNTLALAKAASAALEQQGLTVQLINVSGYSEDTVADLTGVLFPVYAFGAPRIVNRFLRRLPRGEGRAAFVIANAAENAGPAAADMARTLAAKGYNVLVAEWLKMPNNYILGKPAVEDGEAAAVIAAGEKSVQLIVSKVLAPGYSKNIVAGTGGAFYRLVYWAFMKGLNIMSRFYRTNDKCIGCGACVELCPTGTITLNAQQRPVWGKGCEHCMRCVNLCPTDAIEVGKLTTGKKRYKYWQGKS